MLGQKAKYRDNRDVVGGPKGLSTTVRIVPHGNPFPCPLPLLLTLCVRSRHYRFGVHWTQRLGPTVVVFLTL